MEPNKINKRFVDEVTQKRIDSHLTDINDVISEQDIKNIRTDIGSSEAESEIQKKTDNTVDTDDTKEDKSNDEGQTPWSILE